MSVIIFIGIVYIEPTIQGMYVSCCFHLFCIYHARGKNVSWCFCWYFIYHANNWWDKCKLLGVFGVGSLWALRPLGGGIYVIWCIHGYCIYPCTHIQIGKLVVIGWKIHNSPPLVYPVNIVSLVYHMNLLGQINIVNLAKLLNMMSLMNLMNLRNLMKSGESSEYSETVEYGKPSHSGKTRIYFSIC